MLLLLLFVNGCVGRRGPKSALTEPLRRADSAWEARASSGLGPVQAALDEAYGLGPKEGKVLWRLARLRVAQGLLEDGQRARAHQFAQARQVAMACVESSPRYRRLADEHHYLAAATALSDEQQPCVAWAGYAWSRWMLENNVQATSLDLPVVLGLLDAMRHHPEASVSGTAEWGLGIIALSAPPWMGLGLDGEALLSRASRQFPHSLALRVDRARLLGANAPTWLIQSTQTMKSDGPEGEAMRRRWQQTRASAQPPEEPPKNP